MKPVSSYAPSKNFLTSELTSKRVAFPDCALSEEKSVPANSSFERWSSITRFNSLNFHSHLEHTLMTDLFKCVLDIKANGRHFLLLAEPVDSSECLFFDIRVPVLMN